MSFNLRIFGKNYLVKHVSSNYVGFDCGQVIQRGGGFSSDDDKISEGAQVLYRRGNALKAGYSIVHADEIVAVVRGEENHED